MKTKDLLTIGTTALGTAALTVVFLATPPTSATDSNTTTTTIAQPKLSANGIEVTLSAAMDRKFNAGDQPEFELRAVNTLNEPAAAVICATMSSMTPVSPMSRVVAIPVMIWHQDIELALKPSETKVLTLGPKTNLPANKEISISLSQVSQAEGNPGSASVALLGPRGAGGIVALRFSTVPPKTSPGVAGAASGGPAAIAVR
jgi:hypothetical protein